MKVELRINGRYEIELSPENELERVMLSEISERANKGQPITFDTAQQNCCRVGVDK